MSIAWLFPGQGAQAVGMGLALAEAYPSAKAVFDRADVALGEPLSKLVFEGPVDALTLTENAQPAMVATSMAALAAIKERYPDIAPPSYAAGHSLGEYSALVAAGALSLEDGVRLVRARGLAMQAAVPEDAGSMAAIIGVDTERLEAICAEVSAELGEVVVCANYNAPGQVVIAGNARAVQRASDIARERARSESTRSSSIPLKVSAPFHCSLMAPAAKVVADELTKIEVAPLAFPVIANVDARPNADHGKVSDLLVRQVDAPVRWEQIIRAMHELGVTHAIEIGPGKVLAGLCKRIVKEMNVVSVGDPKSLDALGDFLASA